MKKNHQEIIEFINQLQGCEGYIQWSHRPINKEKDIFYNNEIKIGNEDGFVYEAHFCNGQNAIAIRQVNDAWIVDEVDISKVTYKDDKKSYISDIVNLPRVVMAQIWQEEPDALCEGMRVKKLKKVVFAGFEKGEAQ